MASAGDEAFIGGAEAVKTIELGDGDVKPEELMDDLAIEGAEGADAAAADSKDKIAVPEGFVEQDDAAFEFTEHKDPVYCVAFHPTDSNLIVSGDGDDLAYVWERSTGKVVHKLKGHTDTVIDASFSADGKHVATGAMDCTVRVYQTDDGKLVQALEGPAAEIEWIQWHPKGPVLVAGCADGMVWMWHALTGTCMQVFAGHTAKVLCGGFTPGGKGVVTASEDGSMFVWNPKSGKAKHHIKSGDAFHEMPVTCLDVHAQEKLVLTGSADNTACLSSLDSGRVLQQLSGHQDSIEAVGLCKTLKLAATGSLDNTLRIWDLQTGQLRVTCEHDDGIIGLKWHPTQPWVFTASLDKTTRLWDARTGKCLDTWRGHQDGVLCLDVTKDGKWLVTGSDDGTCKVFAVEAK